MNGPLHVYYYSNRGYINVSGIIYLCRYLPTSIRLPWLLGDACKNSHKQAHKYYVGAYISWYGSRYVKFMFAGFKGDALFHV